MKILFYIFGFLLSFNVKAQTTSSADSNTVKKITCDIVILKNGDEISSKVMEISPTEIKYKRCEVIDGPLYVIKKSDAFLIKYANGTKEVFNEPSKTAIVEDKKTAAELEHARQCDNNSRAAHRIVLIGGIILAGLYILAIVSSM